MKQKTKKQKQKKKETTVSVVSYFHKVSHPTNYKNYSFLVSNNIFLKKLCSFLVSLIIPP